MSSNAQEDVSRAIVTGASGFIGGHLVNALTAEGIEVIAVTRGGGAIAGAHATFATLDEALGEAGVRAVYHLAGLAHDNVPDGQALLDRVNVQETCRSFETSLDQGVDRFVWLSSIKVLGESAAAPLTVAAPLNPQGLYAESKARAEEALREAVRARPELRGRLAIVRPPLVYGPGVKANFAALASWVVRGRPLPFGRAHQPRAWVSVDNLCSLLIALGEAGELRSDTWHVRDEEESSVREMVEAIATAAQVSPKLLAIPEILVTTALRLTGRAGLATRLLAPLRVDMSQTQALLGWQPPGDRSATLTRTIAALSSP